MNEGTSVLLGLEDEFTVLQVERLGPGMVRVVHHHSLTGSHDVDGCAASWSVAAG